MILQVISGFNQTAQEQRGEKEKQKNQPALGVRQQQSSWSVMLQRFFIPLITCHDFILLTQKDTNLLDSLFKFGQTLFSKH